MHHAGCGLASASAAAAAAAVIVASNDAAAAIGVALTDSVVLLDLASVSFVNTRPPAYRQIDVSGPSAIVVGLQFSLCVYPVDVRCFSFRLRCWF